MDPYIGLTHFPGNNLLPFQDYILYYYPQSRMRAFFLGKQFILFLFTFLLLKLNGHSQQTRGLYVDNFINIVGNAAREDSLLNYAKDNGFNYLLLYNIYTIHNNRFSITEPGGADTLSRFIRKAKTLYGVTQVGAVGADSTHFKVLDEYNKDHKNIAQEKLDVYHLEYEYWKMADTTEAFNEYIGLLSYVRQLADIQLPHIVCEAYIGKITLNQGKAIAGLADRVLVHYYYKAPYFNDGRSIYTYMGGKRIEYLGSGNRKISVLPLFSARASTDGQEQHLGDWLLTHPFIEAYEAFLDSEHQGYDAATGAWKNNISIDGFQWYRYSDIRKYPSRPYIATQPSNAAVARGQSAVLETEAYGQAPLIYQWSKNGIPLPGANSSRLVLSDVTSSDGGIYQCVITNGPGVIQSSQAKLSVVTFDSPVNNTRYSADKAAATLRVSATGNPPIDSVVYKSNGNNLGKSAVAPFNLGWKGNVAGKYVFSAAVFFKDGTKVSVTDTVYVNARPSVSIASPSPGADLTEPASVNLSASANDIDGTVREVRYYINGSYRSTVSRSPFNSQVTLSAGSYTITAVAVDNDGDSASSAPVSILIKPAPVENANIYSVYPNPANYYINVSINSPEGNDARVVIADKSNTVVYSDTYLYVQPGSNTFSFSLWNVPNGLCTVYFIEDKKTTVIPLMVAK